MMRPMLPANATIECPDLPTVPDGAEWEDLLVNHIEVTGLYHECKARHKALLDSVSNAAGQAQ